jgi:hypothetical protein
MGSLGGLIAARRGRLLVLSAQPGWAWGSPPFRAARMGLVVGVLSGAGSWRARRAARRDFSVVTLQAVAGCHRSLWCGCRLGRVMS